MTPGVAGRRRRLIPVPAPSLHLQYKTSNIFPETIVQLSAWRSWGFLTTHARVLLCIAHDPGARLRDIAATLGVTERRAHGIVTDLTQSGYLIRQKDGRRNRYQVQAHLPLPGPGTREPGTREPAIGEIVALFAAQSEAIGSNSTGEVNG